MKKYLTPLFLLVLLTLGSCGSTRYAGSGTKMSDIREFAFLKPCAYMALYDTDGRSYHQGNVDIATNIITQIINAERFPFTDVMEADYQGEDKDALEWALNLSEVNAKQVDRLRVPKSLLKRMESVDNRYGLFIYSEGYTTTQEAYDAEKRAKAASRVIDAAAKAYRNQPAHQSQR